MERGQLMHAIEHLAQGGTPGSSARSEPGAPADGAGDASIRGRRDG
jgi:hypothetical protein